MDRILVIDSDETIRAELELAAKGFPKIFLDFTHVATGTQALARLELTDFDVVFFQHGLLTDDEPDIIRKISERLREGCVVLVGKQERELLACEAQDRGAFDCLSSPVRPAELQLLLSCIRQRIALLRKQARLDHQIMQIHEDRTIVAASEAMIETLELLERAADSDVPALLIGEVGTRKPLMAQTIHTQSSRRGGPFIEAKCGQFKESEINQKLFGAPAGASQGWRGSNCGLIALADRGTLFLGQVEKLPIELQRGLLHVIEERELWNDQESLPRHVDVRVIAASSEDLATAVSQGRFDSKLYERLRMMTIPLPSLKDRRKDIPLLVDQFLAHFQRSLGKNIGPLSSEALERLCDYSWPGNVRELQNAIERAIILAQDGGITLAHLPRGIVEDYRTQASDCGENFALKPARITFETQLIVRALQATDGNRTRAAALLGISHRSLLYKLKAYSIRD